ncbi:MAG: signal peptidase II [bacterium]|nr:signal peptidase II [bacterium]
MFNKKYSLLIITGLAIDQLSKTAAQKYLAFYRPVKVITGMFHLHLVHNYGAAYGILQNKRLFLISISLAVLLICIIFRNKIANSTLSKTGLSFLLIGTTGNLIDRILRGYVIDFIDIRIFPVFNFADMSIDIGILCLALDIFLYNENDKAKDK